MKNTNFCAKANMKRDVNRVEPARRVLLKADESAAICGAANIGTRSAAGRIVETPHAAQPE